MKKHPFTIEHDGKTYDCERVVTGQRVLQQTITVIGVGSKEDSASYGNRYHPPGSVDATARLIAHEIVQGM